MVHHQSFGRKSFDDGTVKETNGNQIVIDFDSEGQKRLKYPWVVLEGLVQFEDVSITERIRLNNKMEKELLALQSRAKSIEEVLSKLLLESV